MTAMLDVPLSHWSDTASWGSWLLLEEGPGYKVRRLTVRPGERLSYQSHRFRSESWLVVSGVATCTVAGMVRPARAGAVVEIPCGAWHRLANNGTEDVTIVEVQLGSYVGEDDIVLHEDSFGRV